MKNRKTPANSLSMQLFCSVIVSLFIAIATFAVSIILFEVLLAKTVYGQPFMESMADKRFHELQDYVECEQITLDNLPLLSIWCKKGDKVYLSVSNGNHQLFEYPSLSGLTNINEDVYSEENSTTEADYDSVGQEYALSLADNTQVQVSLYYYTSDAFYYWSIVFSCLLAAIIFSFCFISFVHQKIAYIMQLKSELDILAGGELTYQITLKGQDELFELANGIDQMRKSILVHQNTEEEIRLANSQLVTAMSHDLRTPLTSLLAYLEMLHMKKYEDEKQLQHFISRSFTKAMQIKDMADKLFEYFFVYSTEWEQPDLEPVLADSLFQQFWCEYAFSLESKDFQVICDFHELTGSVSIHAELLRRAFDNLYSNLVKYASKEQPISICYGMKEHLVYLTIHNFILKTENKRESTNIGLKTCSRIVSYHHGSFSSSEDDGKFTVTITLPCNP